MKAAISVELLSFLDANRIPYSLVTETGGDGALADDRKRQQLEAVKRWFYHDWRRIDPKLRTSIVEGISVFLSLFDDNPSVKYTFCPPKELFDPELNKDDCYGIPLPPFSEMLEQGKVCALNFPVSINPGLARTIGTLMKQDFQRAVLNRIPVIESIVSEQRVTWVGAHVVKTNMPNAAIQAQLRKVPYMPTPFDVLAW